MATYTWNGSGFNEGTPSRTFLLSSDNISFYYDPQYLSFYNTDETGYGFSGDDSPTNFVVGYVFTDEPQFDQYITPFVTALIQAKYQDSQNDSSNSSIYSQTSSSYVSSTLTSGVSALQSSGNASTPLAALSNYAPFLVNPQANFAFNDILNNWNNGPAIISSLTGLLSNFQGITMGAFIKTKAVTDFKTKLVRQMTLAADETSKLQQTANNFLATNTFSALASAFPQSGLPQFNQLLMAHNAALEQELCTLMPVLAKGASIEGVINQVLGGKIYNILSPMDKIIADINNSNNVVSNLIAAIPTSGYTFTSQASGYTNPYIQNQSNNEQISNLNNMTNFTNQAVNLLANVATKIPIVPKVPTPAPITNSSQILNSLISSTTTSLFGKSSLTAAQKAVADKVNIAATTTSPVSSISSIAVNPVEPAQGGSFANLGIFSNILNFPDPTVKPPIITLALDPTIASMQTEAQQAQSTVDNAAAYTANVPQGSGPNIFLKHPVTGRNLPINGSLGSFNTSSLVEIVTKQTSSTLS